MSDGWWVETKEFSQRRGISHSTPLLQQDSRTVGFSSEGHWINLILGTSLGYLFGEDFIMINVFSSSHALAFEGPAQLLHPLLRMGDDLRMKKWSLINVGSWSEGAKSLTPEKISTLHLTWGRLLPLLVFSASDIFFFLVTHLHKKMQFLFCEESNNLKFNQSYIKKDIITFMLQVKYHWIN